MCVIMIFSSKPLGTIAYLGGIIAVPEPFLWSMVQCIQWCNEYLCEPGWHIHLDRAKVSYHAYARNSLIERMQGDWLLMLDTDHQFEPDLPGRLLKRMQSYDVDVISAMYQMKDPPHVPVMYQRQENGFFAPIGYWEVQMQEIGSAGAGCLLVKRRVFDRIRSELGENSFDIIPPFSEDHSFFQRLHKLGIKAYGAMNVECNHLQLRPITLSDFDREAVKLGERYEVGGFV